MEKKSRVIVVEDEFFVANHLCDLLENLGYSVSGVFHNGEEFLENTDWKFDAAILDIFLSKTLTGLDLAKKMNEQHKPFIFLTANQDEKTLREAAILGPKAYIGKPFKIIDVKAALEILFIQLPEKIKVKGVYGLEDLNPYDINFVKTDKNYVEIHTNEVIYRERKSLKEMLEILPNDFAQVHRFYVVNKRVLSKERRFN